jgi:hypothetical protein
MTHHLTPHLLTGSAILGAMLFIVALVITTIMFCWSFHGSTRRILVTINLIGLTVGFQLLRHNYHHLQAAVLTGVALGIIGTVALVLLVRKAWPIEPKAPGNDMQYNRQRSAVISYAAISFGGLVSGTILLAITNFTWHWT